jgi:hypothetical protein
MAKLFTPNDPAWADEELVESPLHKVLDGEGDPIPGNVTNLAETMAAVNALLAALATGAKIELATEVTVAGTSLTATRMNNIEDGLDAVDAAVNVEGHDAKTTPVDADEVNLWDSIASAWKSLSWANIKTTLKTYMDTLYLALVAPGTSGNVLTSNGTAWTSAAPSSGGEVKVRGFVSNPQAVYAQRARIVIMRADAALTITRIHIHCSDTSPTAELAGDLKFADDINVGGFANATIIDVCDTTNGVVTITTGFDDATVPSGKYVYFQMDASPHADIKDFYIEVFYTYD